MRTRIRAFTFFYQIDLNKLPFWEEEEEEGRLRLIRWDKLTQWSRFYWHGQPWFTFLQELQSNRWKAKKSRKILKLADRRTKNQGQCEWMLDGRLQSCNCHFISRCLSNYSGVRKRIWGGWALRWALVNWSSGANICSEAPESVIQQVDGGVPLPFSPANAYIITC